MAGHGVSGHALFKGGELLATQRFRPRTSRMKRASGWWPAEAWNFSG